MNSIQRKASTDDPLARQEEFQALFNDGWTQNGPAGFNNLAFSFHIGNSLFIIADSFYAPSDGSPPAYGINQAQQDWIKGLLQNNNAAHTFVLDPHPGIFSLGAFGGKRHEGHVADDHHIGQCHQYQCLDSVCRA